MSEQQRTIGLFVKQPVPGQVKTRLAASIGDEPAARLYAAFQHDILRQLAAGPHHLVVYFSPDSDESRRWFESLTGELPQELSHEVQLWPQPNGHLGQRLQVFFERALRTSSTALVLGSDSPTLSLELITQAWKVLERSDAVLGPAADGGYYLLGLNRRTLERGCRPESLFDNIDWSTSRVLLQTIRKLQSARISCDLLPVWYDVDELHSLALLYSHCLLRTAPELPSTAAVLKCLWSDSAKLEQTIAGS